MLFQLPATGSVLLIGHDQSWQSIVVGQIAAEALCDRGNVVYLTDSEGEGRAAATALQDRLRASGASLDALKGYCFVDNVALYRGAHDLKAKIEARCAGKPSIIVRDLGSSWLETLPGAPWLDQADELAVLMDCPVLTAAHYGSSPRPAPDVTRYHADEVWVCHAGISLQLTLHRRKPSDRIVKLKGRVMPYGVIDFEPAKPEQIQ